MRISNREEWDTFIKMKFQAMIDEDPYEFEDYDGVEQMLKELQDGEWSSYCPRIKKRIKESCFPDGCEDSCTSPLWTGDCCDFKKEDVDYIRRVIGMGALPRGVFHKDININETGCTGCWAFNYYYVLAWLIDNEYFWNL